MVKLIEQKKLRGEGREKNIKLIEEGRKCLPAFM
jgi:hypothetical protein